MIKVLIDDMDPERELMTEYLKTLPYAVIIDEPKKSFREAAEECNAISVESFTAELRRRISENFPDENSSPELMGGEPVHDEIERQ